MTTPTRAVRIATSLLVILAATLALLGTCAVNPFATRASDTTERLEPHHQLLPGQIHIDDLEAPPAPSPEARSTVEEVQR